MNMVVYIFGDMLDINLVSIWAKEYQKYETTIPVTLLYKDVSKEVLQLWPYKSIEIKEKIHVKFDRLNVHLRNNIICDYIKMLAFRYCGESIIMDIDCISQRKLTLSNVPECNWGMVQKTLHNSYSSITYARPESIKIFDEFEEVEDCYAGLQIQRRDYFEDYIKYFNKYIYQINNLKCPGLYGELIISLVHKINNGTYLLPEWNWMFDCRYQNNNKYFEHYCSPLGKNLLLYKNFKLPIIKQILKK